MKYLKRTAQIISIASLALCVACGGGNKNVDPVQQDPNNGGPITGSGETPPAEPGTTPPPTLSEQFACTEGTLKLVNHIDPNNPSAMDYNFDLNASLYKGDTKRVNGSPSVLATYFDQSIQNGSNLYIARNATLDPNTGEFNQGTGMLNVDKPDGTSVSQSLGFPIHHLRIIKSGEDVLVYASTDGGLKIVKVGAGLEEVSSYFTGLHIVHSAVSESGVIFAATADGYLVRTDSNSPQCAFAIYDPSSSVVAQGQNPYKAVSVEVSDLQQRVFFMTKNYGSYRFDLEMLVQHLGKLLKLDLFSYQSKIWEAPISGQLTPSEIDIANSNYPKWYSNSMAVDRHGQLAINVKFFNKVRVNEIEAIVSGGGTPTITDWLKVWADSNDQIVLIAQDRIKVSNPIFKSFQMQIGPLTFTIPNLGLFGLSPIATSSLENSNSCDVAVRGLLGYACFVDTSLDNNIEANHLANPPDIETFWTLLNGFGSWLDFSNSFVMRGNRSTLSVGLDMNQRSLTIGNHNAPVQTKNGNNPSMPLLGSGHKRAVSILGKSIDLDDPINGLELSLPSKITDNGKDYFRVSAFPTLIVGDAADGSEDYLVSVYQYFGANPFEAKIALFDIDAEEPAIPGQMVKLQEATLALVNGESVSPNGAMQVAMQPLSHYGLTVFLSTHYKDQNTGDDNTYVRAVKFEEDAANPGSWLETTYQVAGQMPREVGVPVQGSTKVIKEGDNYSVFNVIAQNNGLAQPAINRITLSLDDANQTMSLVNNDSYVPQASSTDFSLSIFGSLHVVGNELFVLQKDSKLSSFQASNLNGGASTRSLNTLFDGVNVNLASQLITQTSVLGEEIFVNLPDFSNGAVQLKLRAGSIKVNGENHKNYPFMQIWSLVSKPGNELLLSSPFRGYERVSR